MHFSTAQLTVGLGGVGVGAGGVVGDGVDVAGPPIATPGEGPTRLAVTWSKDHECSSPGVSCMQ